MTTTTKVPTETAKPWGWAWPTVSLPIIIVATLMFTSFALGSTMTYTYNSVNYALRMNLPLTTHWVARNLIYSANSAVALIAEIFGLGRWPNLSTHGRLLTFATLMVTAVVALLMLVTAGSV